MLAACAGHPCRVSRREILLALCSAAALAAPSRALAQAAVPPLRVVFEQDRFGCEPGLRIEIDGSGELQRIQPSKGRCGLAEQRSSLRVSRAQVQALAQRAKRLGFFDLQEQFEPDGTDAVVDGTWAQLTIESGGRSHAVFSREGAGPAWLLKLHADLLALAGASPP